MPKDQFTINDLRELLMDSTGRLQKLPERQKVSPETDILFDHLAQEYCYMFSYIIDYLEQNR